MENLARKYGGSRTDLFVQETLFFEVNHFHADINEETWLRYSTRQRLSW